MSLVLRIAGRRKRSRGPSELKLANLESKYDVTVQRQGAVWVWQLQKPGQAGVVLSGSALSGDEAQKWARLASVWIGGYDV
jgi:hypothetical protein